MDPLYPLFKDYFFATFHPPKIRLEKPAWINHVNKYYFLAFILVSYFFFTGGVIYDLILEPPSIGTVQDDRGRLVPQAIMPYRLNGQYMIEGFFSSFFFVLGGMGLILVDMGATIWKKKALTLIVVGVSVYIVSYLIVGFCIRIKVPGYLG